MQDALAYRFVTDSDLDLLARWNRQLILDEGHRNRMTVPELRERMKQWLAGDYKAVVFLADGDTVAYGVYREDTNEVYLRQFFVRRDKRRCGIGRKAIATLRDKIWAASKRLTVDVLATNTIGIEFWRALGYRDYCLAMEIMPGNQGAELFCQQDVPADPQGPAHPNRETAISIRARSGQRDPMDLLIREVRSDDAEAIAGILNAIIESGAYSALDTLLTAEDEREFIRDFPRRGVFHLAEDSRDHRAVGFQTLEPYATYTHAFDHVAVIATFVDLGCRRRGVGRRLSEATFEAARAKGYEKILTFVRADNPEALQYYLKLGFRVVGTAQKQARIGSNYVDEIIIEKSLRS